MSNLALMDEIIGQIRNRVSERISISPAEWLDAASELNVLVLDLDDELNKAEMEVNTTIAERVESGDSYAAARSFAKASEAYGRYLMLKAKRQHIAEFIRLAKKRTELARWEQN